MLLPIRDTDKNTNNQQNVETSMDFRKRGERELGCVRTPKGVQSIISTINSNNEPWQVAGMGLEYRRQNVKNMDCREMEEAVQAVSSHPIVQRF